MIKENEQNWNSPVGKILSSKKGGGAVDSGGVMSILEGRLSKLNLTSDEGNKLNKVSSAVGTKVTTLRSLHTGSSPLSKKSHRSETYFETKIKTKLDGLNNLIGIKSENKEKEKENKKTKELLLDFNKRFSSFGKNIMTNQMNTTGTLSTLGNMGGLSGIGGIARISPSNSKAFAKTTNISNFNTLSSFKGQTLNTDNKIGVKEDLFFKTNESKGNIRKERILKDIDIFS